MPDVRSEIISFESYCPTHRHAGSIALPGPLWRVNVNLGVEL